MGITLEDKFVVAISSRALFDFEEENKVFDDTGNDTSYMSLQLDRLELPAKPGVAFSLISKLLAFNTPERQWVEVVILSRNDPVSGLRVLRSAKHHKLNIVRSVFTRGRPAWKYLHPLKANLFLSAKSEDVRAALQAGFPAATVATRSAKAPDNFPNEVRIALDGDAVLFSDEAERIYQEGGLAKFQQHEVKKASKPLPPGPFKPLLEALHLLQQSGSADMRIRTALVTARSAPAHERAIRTLMAWNITVDEAMFLGGLEKGPFLQQFEPDFFFDDQAGHVQSAADHVPAGLVESGVSNQR